MKKKLVLSRETLRCLEDERLAVAKGGGSGTPICMLLSVVTKCDPIDEPLCAP